MSKHRRPTHSRRRAGLAAAALGVAALTTLGASAPAVAAKAAGGGKNTGSTSSSSLTLVLLDSTDGQAHWGQRVTFDVSTTATDAPYVDLACSQNGTVVLGATAGFFDSYPWPWTQVMTLSSQSWTGGDADCSATLYYLGAKRKYVLSTLNFHAYA